MSLQCFSCSSFVHSAISLPLARSARGIKRTAYPLAVLFLFCATSCGYTFQGSGSVLPPDVRKIYIPIAENDTTEPGLGPRLTEAVRERFERYGVVTVVDREQEADAILKTRVVDVESRVGGVTSKTDIAVESVLYMTVTAELRRRNGQLLYRNTGLQASENAASVGATVVTTSSAFQQSDVSAATIAAVGASGSQQIARSQQQQALDDLLDEVARKMYLDAIAADFLTSKSLAAEHYVEIRALISTRWILVLPLFARAVARSRVPLHLGDLERAA